MDEEKVEFRNNGCTDQTVVTQSSNIDPKDKWDLCKNCQFEEMGVWSGGVRPIAMLKEKEVKLTNKEKVEVVLEILERQKKDEPFATIAEALCRPQKELENLFNHSYHHDLQDYKEKQPKRTKKDQEEVILNVVER